MVGPDGRGAGTTPDRRGHVRRHGDERVGVVHGFHFDTVASRSDIQTCDAESMEPCERRQRCDTVAPMGLLLFY
jgi:hypothetical protein